MRCQFCEQSNPDDARFCNACGAQLNLVPCPNCGAVNESSAPACFQCNRPLGGHAKDNTGVPASDVPEAAIQSKRASSEHRFEVMELMGAATSTHVSPIRFRFSGPARLTYAVSVVAFVIALIAGSVYLEKRNFSLAEPSSTSIGDASYPTRPIRSTAVDAPEPGHALDATAPGDQADPATSCTRGVAALGLCGSARVNAGLRRSDARKQPDATAQ